MTFNSCSVPHPATLLNASLMNPLLLLVLFVMGLMVSPSNADDGTGDARSQFVSVDTSRLMTSPYPYTLENAFPNMDFGDKGPLQLLTAPHDHEHVYVLCRDGELHQFANDSSVSESNVLFDISHKLAMGKNKDYWVLRFIPSIQRTVKSLPPMPPELNTGLRQLTLT